MVYYKALKVLQISFVPTEYAHASRSPISVSFHQKLASSTIHPIFSERMCLCVLFSLSIIFMLMVHTLSGFR